MTFSSIRDIAWALVRTRAEDADFLGAGITGTFKNCVIGESDFDLPNGVTDEREMGGVTATGGEGVTEGETVVGDIGRDLEGMMAAGVRRDTDREGVLAVRRGETEGVIAATDLVHIEGVQ